MSTTRLEHAARALAFLAVSLIAVACGVADPASEGGSNAGGTTRTELGAGAPHGAPTAASTAAPLAAPASGDVSAGGGAGAGTVAGGAAPSSAIGPAVASASVATPTRLRGANLVGMEGGYGFDQAAGPIPDKDYAVHSTSVIDYLASKNVGVMRFLFSWERVQSTLNGPVPASSSGNYKSYFDDYRRIVDYATNTKGMTVIMEPWQASASGGVGGPSWRGNTVGGGQVTSAHFADFWSKMAAAYSSNPRVAIGLVNEPNGIDTMRWFATVQEAISAIRGAGFSGEIHVPGNGWTAANSWTDPGYDTGSPQRSNAYGWLNARGPGQPLLDPLGKLVASVHTYADADASGSSATVVSSTISRQNVTGVTEWARANGLKVFVGEIGMYAGAVNAAANWNDFVDYLDANGDALLGFTWWGCGKPGWWDGPPLHERDRGRAPPRLPCADEARCNSSSCAASRRAGVTRSRTRVSFSHEADRRGPSVNLRVIVVDGFFAAVVVFVLAIAAYVVGSFALMRAHTERRPLLATLRAMMREVFWLVITQPVAPLWYVVGSRMGRGRGTVPVVFVHGYMQNRIDFIWLTSRLRHARVGTMYGFNYPWMTTVAGNAARLARFVERVCREENAERADVVCHSMGGLVALEYMRHDAHRVRRCVTIAAPHSGVTWRGPMLGFGATDLRRASKFLATLSAIALPVPTLSIFSTHDNVVHPPQTSALAHRGGEDAPLDEGLGHFSMLFSPDVASRVEHFLEKEEPAAAAGGAAPRVQELAIEPLRSS